MISEISNAVSRVFLRLLKVSVQSFKVWEFPVKNWFLTRIWCILENVTFPLKITKKSQTLQLRTETFRSCRKTCDTAFESSDITLFNAKKIWVPLEYSWYPNNNMFEPVWKLTENVPTLPANGILEINVVPQWHPKFYFWQIQHLSFPTPCQPSP